jgi:hypothetical protein
MNTDILKDTRELEQIRIVMRKLRTEYDPELKSVYFSRCSEFGISPESIASAALFFVENYFKNKKS